MLQVFNLVFDLILTNGAGAKFIVSQSILSEIRSIFNLCTRSVLRGINKVGHYKNHPEVIRNLGEKLPSEVYFHTCDHRP